MKSLLEILSKTNEKGKTINGKAFACSRWHRKNLRLATKNNDESFDGYEDMSSWWNCRRVSTSFRPGVYVPSFGSGNPDGFEWIQLLGSPLASFADRGGTGPFGDFGECGC